MANWRKLFSALRLVAAIGFVAIAAWLVFNRQQVIDWYYLQGYTPSAEVASLAKDTTMTNKGKNLFYASRPQIKPKTEFSQYCTNDSEETIVLGCYKMQQIFLFDVTDERLRGVEQVTAAHEMLHAAYERLDSGARQKVNSLLDKQLAGINDGRLKELVDIYNKQEPGQLSNEMHSILATEYRQLSPELEDYFSQYFTNRLKVVSYSEGYEEVFRTSKERITSLDVQLEQLKTKIEANNAELEKQQKVLQAQSNSLNQLLSHGRVAEYNDAVPAYNSAVEDFNNKVAQTQVMIDQYNSLVVQRNTEATAQNDLYKSLDSRYQPVQ